MEDQSADSSDLNADAAAASVPQGKAGRNRHRLPRQKAQQVDQPDETTEAVEAPEATEPAAEVPAEVAAEEADEVDESDIPDVAEVVPAEPKRRRRPLWKRGKADADPVAVEAEAAETSDVEAPDVEASDVDAEEPEDVVLVPHRTAGRALKLVAVAAGVLFVGAAAFAGAAIQPYLADRAAVQTKFVIAETAASAITTLWTYTPDDMDKLPERSAKYLGGDFAADYKRYIDAIVAPNKQAQVTNNTQVLGAAVESLTPTEATAIVYTNSVATSPVTKGIPSLRYLSYRLTMKPQGNRWLITQMVAVTKLDLTPRL
ncbi:mammalian cell entry protein [Mycobacterium hodleri]|uniref:Mammalian cell entry protein n=1 Tax=Mycolicibacterium hodleri TaxID=49897 RepID=A0A544W0T0_9MYCO|nr:mammalian cell entry protein [Mycolicibacterium hodleri]TQR85837.1 mammalian cell entry protein [Mycolicibacterium hodleri]